MGLLIWGVGWNEEKEFWVNPNVTNKGLHQKIGLCLLTYLKCCDWISTAIHFDHVPRTVSRRGKPLKSTHTEWSGLSVQHECENFSKISAPLSPQDYYCELRRSHVPKCHKTGIVILDDWVRTISSKESTWENKVSIHILSKPSYSARLVSGSREIADGESHMEWHNLPEHRSKSRENLRLFLSKLYNSIVNASTYSHTRELSEAKATKFDPSS